MEEFSQSQLEELQQKLQRLDAELTEQLRISEAAAGIVVLDQTSVGRVSRVDALQQQSMAVSTREKATLTLRKVKLALKAILDQDYGYCRQCDEAIAYLRLQAQPHAALCLQCQDKADRQ